MTSPRPGPWALELELISQRCVRAEWLTDPLTRDRCVITKPLRGPALGRAPCLTPGKIAQCFCTHTRKMSSSLFSAASVNWALLMISVRGQMMSAVVSWSWATLTWWTADSANLVIPVSKEKPTWAYWELQGKLERILVKCCIRGHMLFFARHHSTISEDCGEEPG